MSSTTVTRSKPVEPRYFVEALERGIKVLEAFTAERTSLSLTQIATVTGLDKTTAFRLIYTLQAMGYIQRQAGSRRYSLGYKLLSQSYAALNGSALVQIAQPVLTDLSARCGETTDLSVRDSADAVVIALQKAVHMAVAHYHVGTRAPLHSSAAGKVLISEMSRDQLIGILGEGPFVGVGPRAISQLDALWADLELTRRRGYALSDEELFAGLRSVAAAVRDAQGQIVASLAIVAPSARLTGEQLGHQMAPLVTDAAGRISAALGERPHGREGGGGE